MPFHVRFTAEARSDLERLFGFLVSTARDDLDLDRAIKVIELLEEAINTKLAVTPLLYRKLDSKGRFRELLISWGRAGYVVLYELKDPSTVLVCAVRHQREDDFHAGMAP